MRRNPTCLGSTSSHWLVRPSPSGGRIIFSSSKGQCLSIRLLPSSNAGLILTPGGFEIYPTETHKFSTAVWHNPRGPHDRTLGEVLSGTTKRAASLESTGTDASDGPIAVHEVFQQEPQHGPSAVTKQSVAHRHSPTSETGCPLRCPKTFKKVSLIGESCKANASVLLLHVGHALDLSPHELTTDFRWHFEDAWLRGYMPPEPALP